MRQHDSGVGAREGDTVFLRRWKLVLVGFKLFAQPSMNASAGINAGSPPTNDVKSTVMSSAKSERSRQA